MKTAAALLLSLIAATAIAHPEHEFDEPAAPAKLEVDAKAKQADAVAKDAADKAKADSDAARAAAAKAVKKP
ncbi:hypothetical protein [Nevskia ramosa]|uniref:hypothetical protein n=1 Tax=Nevskia ramosa TaxID=64002 RepID=UPI002353A03D|nr:hypothetical protein [Nevskia ramosa]